MQKRQRHIISDCQKRAVERALENGDRVELIPVKNGVRVLLVKRNEIGLCHEREC